MLEDRQLKSMPFNAYRETLRKLLAITATLIEVVAEGERLQAVWELHLPDQQEARGGDGEMKQTISCSSLNYHGEATYLW